METMDKFLRQADTMCAELINESYQHSFPKLVLVGNWGLIIEANLMVPNLNESKCCIWF